jgi:hypothetical protein
MLEETEAFNTYHHANRNFLATGLFLESLIKDNVHEDL